MAGEDALEAHFSPMRHVLIGLLGLGFVAAGFWLTGAIGEFSGSERISADTASIIGYFNIAFFGAVALIAFWTARRTDVAVRVDSHGIFAVKQFKEAVPWDNIDGLASVTLHHNKFLAFEISKPERFCPTRLADVSSDWNVRNIGYPFAITTLGTTKSYSELMAAIERFAPTRLKPIH